MSWTDRLASGIEQALSSGGPARIAVHSEAQAGLGESAAGRMADSPEAAANLTFELIPEDQHDQYPVGAVLVP